MVTKINRKEVKKAKEEKSYNNSGSYSKKISHTILFRFFDLYKYSRPFERIIDMELSTHLHGQAKNPNLYIYL